MNIRNHTVALLLAAGAALSSAWAAEPGMHRGTAKACKQDVETLCAGVKPGEGRIAACLKEKQDQVSDGCKTAIKGAAAGRKGSKAASSAAPS